MSRRLSFVWWGQAPSKSNYRKGGKNWREQWARIKQFETDIGWLAREQLPRLREQACSSRPFLEWKPPHVTIHAHKQRADSDNISKATLDAMEKVLYLNDKGVGVTVIPKDDGPARLEVSVEWEEERE